MKSAQTKLSIVFCRGIWADGSCFSKVIPPLQAEGHEVIAAQYGLDTNEGDVAMVKRALGRVSSPAILVGHSYGGSVITLSHRSGGWSSLVTPFRPGVLRRGSFRGGPEACVWATHYAPAAELFTKNAPGIAWKSKPSWYIVANNDRTVHPDLQRFVAKRMGASTHAVDSSHVPMLSNPKLVIDVIRAAANAVVQGAKRA